MDYYLIKGHFHVVGYSPDGDSLMFEAAEPKEWEKIKTQFHKLFDEKLEESGGSVQLRLQGIDALETHYGPAKLAPPRELWGKSYEKAEQPSPGNYRQPADYGEQATLKLLSYLGVEDVEWGSAFGRKWIKKIKLLYDQEETYFTEKGKDKLEGFIVVNDMDRTGRPICWVFGGKTERRDGDHMTDEDLLEFVKQSVNYRLVANGLVYPYFFMTLSAKLRQPLIYAVLNAQRQKMKLWSADVSHGGIKLAKLTDLTDQYLIFPYIFRRIIKHQFKRQMEQYWDALSQKKAFQTDPNELFLDSFFEDTNPYLFLVKERDFIRLDRVVDIKDNILSLSTHPGNIVFLS